MHALHHPTPSRRSIDRGSGEVHDGGRKNILKSKRHRSCDESVLADSTILFPLDNRKLKNSKYQSKSHSMLHHNNTTSKRPSTHQEHFRSWPEAFPHQLGPQSIQAPDHYLPVEQLNMPEAKFTRKHLSLSPEIDGHSVLDLVHPIPKPTLNLSTGNFAPFEQANPKRETSSPFETDPGLTNYSSGDLSHIHPQSSPENSCVGTIDTPISSTYSAITPISWSSFSSSSVSSASSSSSAMPCAWGPDAAIAAATASGTWTTTNMPCSLPNGTQYSNPHIVDAAAWDNSTISSGLPINEEMMLLYNGPPWLDVQAEPTSPSYFLNPYGLEMDVSFHGYPVTDAASADASTCRLNPHNRSLQQNPQPRPPPHSQTIYGTPITTTTNQQNTNTTVHPHRTRDRINSTSTSTSASNTMPNSRNAFLIKCKRRGLSYKDIKRIGGFKEAESTLRGRFRTLTKTKDQRVRKPQWQERDIRLLCEAVNICSYGAHTTTHKRSLSSFPSDPYNSRCRLRGCTVAHGHQQEIPKVSWKRVAHYIWTNGGSYHFGNATCKKKWCEVHNVSVRF